MKCIFILSNISKERKNNYHQRRSYKDLFLYGNQRFEIVMFSKLKSIVKIENQSKSERRRLAQKREKAGTTSPREYKKKSLEWEAPFDRHQKYPHGTIAELVFSPWPCGKRLNRSLSRSIILYHLISIFNE